MGWLVLVLALAACTNEAAGPSSSPGASTSTPSPSASGSPSPSPSVSVTPKPPATATKIVYARSGDLWLYTVATNTLKRLTTTSSDESLPQFVDADRVAYVFAEGAGTTSIYELRLSTGARRRIVRKTGSIAAFRYSPGRTTIAYLLNANDGLANEAHLFVPATNADKKVRDFGKILGREGIEDDEISIRWAPNGMALLVVITPVSESQSSTMFVVRGTGADVVPPRRGTFARFLPDGKRIVYREFGGARRWLSVTVPGNLTSMLAATAGTYRMELSPDGTAFAFDDGKATPSTFLYTFATNSQRSIGAGISPLWMAKILIAVSNTTKCISGNEPCFTPYTLTGTVDRITTTTGARKRLALQSSDANALYQ